MRCKSFLIKAVGFIFVPLFFPYRAYGYIDPGTGMTFVAGIGAWIIGLFAFFIGLISLTFKKWISLIKKIIGSLRKTKPSPKN